MKILWEEPGEPPFFEEYPDLEECRRSPLWTSEEGDFENDWYDYFVPVQVTDPLLLGEEEDFPLMLFVFCEIRLGDGTELDGVIYLRNLYEPEEREREYGLDIFYKGEAIPVPPKVTRDFTKYDSPEEFAQRIGKRLDQITPLTWTSPFRIRILDDRFPNGLAEYPLSGQIDLLTW